MAAPGRRTAHLRAAQATLGGERSRRAVGRSDDAAGADRTRLCRVDIGAARAGTMRRPDRVGRRTRRRQADRISGRRHERGRSDRRVRHHRRRGWLRGQGLRLRHRRRGSGRDPRSSSPRGSRSHPRSFRTSSRSRRSPHKRDRAVAPAHVEARSCSVSVLIGRGRRLQSRIMLITGGTTMSRRIGPISMPPTTTVASGR